MACEATRSWLSVALHAAKNKKTNGYLFAKRKLLEITKLMPPGEPLLKLSEALTQLIESGNITARNPADSAAVSECGDTGQDWHLLSGVKVSPLLNVRDLTGTLNVPTPIASDGSGIPKTLPSPVPTGKLETRSSRQITRIISGVTRSSCDPVAFGFMHGQGFGAEFKLVIDDRGKVTHCAKVNHGDHPAGSAVRQASFTSILNCWRNAIESHNFGPALQRYEASHWVTFGGFDPVIHSPVEIRRRLP